VELVLKKEWGLLEDCAKALIEKRELDYDEIEALFQKHGRTRPVWPGMGRS
jgi:hypothetical protein